MDYKSLPVYQHKEKILEAARLSQVVVVESPTGSGKTTQLPVILYEAGLVGKGIIGVTQPRRIAALSVSAFLAKQLKVDMPGLVGYKMRFADITSPDTKIKIMTDGILLQEMKNDPYLSRYDCILVDEAHERSLTIDFVLGLLKRILEVRTDFRIIVSSATINAEVFSEYFGGAPIVRIDAVTYPVALIYDPPPVPAADSDKDEALLSKICDIVQRLIEERRQGGILIFLSGEKMIKEAMLRLYKSPVARKLHIIPLYGRLGKDEQERIFEKTPWGKTKVIISTNIAETSVTIDGITSVIDSGLSKLSFFSPRTFTTSLVEGQISKASANQRRGRAGRTEAGTCYRLYNRKDFESRPLFTQEEIYRTDLAEVVLQMADLGITEFWEFDFLSSPSRDGIEAAIETLQDFGALTNANTLTNIGKMMMRFPLSPRHARIIVEAILHSPSVLRETIVAVSFLSTQTPFVVPPGEEIEARKAHHTFSSDKGDFFSYLKIYEYYEAAQSKTKFCEKNYLDEKAMTEIWNAVNQIEDIVSNMGVPLTGGGSSDDFLYTMAVGLIHFVCVRESKTLYRTLTADKILIHPGSSLFKNGPEFIVAGEIIRTSRMYASSVSPLSKSITARLGVLDRLSPQKRRKPAEFVESVVKIPNFLNIGGEVFEVITKKGKKTAILPWEKLKNLKGKSIRAAYKGVCGTIIVKGNLTLLENHRLDFILKVLPFLDPEQPLERAMPKDTRLSVKQLHRLLSFVPIVMKIAPRSQNRGLGFVSLRTDFHGKFHLGISDSFNTALDESLASLEALIDELGDDVDIEERSHVNEAYRRLKAYVE